MTAVRQIATSRALLMALAVATLGIVVRRRVRTLGV